MEKKPLALLMGSLVCAALIWSSCITSSVGEASPFRLLPTAPWYARSLVIPGGTGLKHCDDPLSPADDLFEPYRLLISPARPVLGHNVSITAMGRFKSDITTNGTAFYFLDADHAALVGWGDEGFCNNTRVLQTVDGVLGPTCPPVEGHALLRRDLRLDERWPAGEWHVRLDVRNGTSGTAPRLFCVEGDIQVERERNEHELLRRTHERILGRSFWQRQE